MPDQGRDGVITRRRFVRDTGVATAAAVELLTTPAFGARPKRRKKRRPTVAVFGGGVAGLTAAHELAERGFDVTIYERRAWGGEVRSIEVPGTATGGRRPLPAENGFHAEFGCFRNLLDTMRRIPFGVNENGVYDNLVELPQLQLARVSRRDLTLPLGRVRGVQATTPEQALDLIVAALVQVQVPPQAAAQLGNRLAVYMSSCDARRLGQWEKTSWSDFVGADRHGQDFYNLFGRTPEFTQGVKPEEASAKFIAWVFETLVVYSVLGQGSDGRILSAFERSANEAWIDPWVAHLRRLGVRMRVGRSLAGLEVREGQISRARVRTRRSVRQITADWYVCALPLERARRLWTPAILGADPKLAAMKRLGVGWASGVMFYLRDRPDLVAGVIQCSDSPWAITLIPQARLWSADFARTYGDGQVRDKLSCTVATWDRPGVLLNKSAHQCTPDELAREIWEQIKRHVNEPGQPAKLTDRMLHSWAMDPGVLVRRGRLTNEHQLPLPSVDSEQFRPSVTTGIPNLTLCGDYCDGPWEIANTEAASFNGRRAANAVLERAGSRETPAATILPHRPPEWEPLKRIDDDRWRNGQPNLFDVDPDATQTRALLGGIAKP